MSHAPKGRGMSPRQCLHKKFLMRTRGGILGQRLSPRQGQEIDRTWSCGASGADEGRDDRLTSSLLRAGLDICKMLLFGQASCSPCPHTASISEGKRVRQVS